MKVIIVDGHSEDPEEISTCIKTRWPEAVVTLTTAQDDTIRLIKNSLPDLVVIDLAPKEQNGFYLCKEIRSFSEIPIIMLSDNSEDKSVVKGLEWGADDWITKPFSYIQFLARIQAVIRRSQTLPLTQTDNPFKTRDLTVEFDSKEVKVRGKQAKLTYIEYNILYHLIKNIGRPLSSEQLLDKVWGQQYLDTKYLPKIHIQHLRQKIERDPTKPKIIVTERGQGYKLVVSR
jgi:DNA-binding response OmpR family regulator